MEKRNSDSGRAPKVSFVSLGCPKALVDSERIITRLRAEGYELTRGHEGADVAVVNTCGFLDSAQAESLAAIGKAVHANGKVIVTGCMGAEPEKIIAHYPGVLSVTGPQQYESVLEAVHRAVPPQHDPFLDLLPPEGIKLTPRHYAYLKISEGCNNRCSFCIIPKLRGDLVSRPAADVLREAERLVAAGVKELLVISQDTSAYGVIPFQHAAPSVLRRMKRPAAQEKTLERIARWREICPDLTIRSTFIVGFPGESDEDFQFLLDWLEEAELDRVGCFRYEPVKGAVANDLAAPVTDAVKQERWDCLMRHQQSISARRLRRKVGTRQQVIIDEVYTRNSRRPDRGPGAAMAKGRSRGDAPEIDGAVYVTSRRPLRLGEIATVRIERADEYDLHGTAVGY